MITRGYKTSRGKYSIPNGYEAGIRTAEGLLESEYQRGLQNGFADGYDVGLNKGYQKGFDDAYDEIISSDEYTRLW